jgi:AbiU2
LGNPTLKQILDALKHQVLVGKTYLSLATGLLQVNQDDPTILETAPVFFGLTVDGSLELAQMAIARMYDTASGAVTVPRMLQRAVQEIGSFQRGDAQEVSAAIAEAQAIVAALSPVLAAIRTRRNEWLAHLDPRTVADPKALNAKAKVTLPDVEHAFKETERFLTKLSCLYDGVLGDLRFIGGDDYQTVVENLRLYKCACIREFEKQFGTWTGPRPKDCSRKPYDLL